jgi:adenosine deaminase/aminodeoxyfutalosine deaminase
MKQETATLMDNSRLDISEQPSAFVRGLPKAELHLHLEGAVEPETVVELARNHKQQLDLEQVRELYRYTDFTGFLLCFREITQYLQTPDDYELITYRLLQRLAAENVKHAEVYVAVGVCLWRGREFAEIFQGLERGRLRGERDFKVSLYWIFDAVRHFGPEKAMDVAKCAVQSQPCGSVIGFGIGGDERRAGPELFAEAYAYAARHGLRLTCHAGETNGPDSVWIALQTLRSERIGHGLSCWRDRELLAYLVERQVPLEISLSSNLRTGCIRALAQHPVKTYFDLGLLVTLNTDDPAMFETSISREYQIAQETFGFRDEQLKQLARNSFRASFLPEEKKREYLSLLEAAPVAQAD